MVLVVLDQVTEVVTHPVVVQVLDRLQILHVDLVLDLVRLDQLDAVVGVELLEDRTDTDEDELVVLLVSEVVVDEVFAQLQEVDEES